MKKSHLVLLVITSVMVLFSAYSLAAISQVYNINFNWYSMYSDRFTEDHRDLSGDKWYLNSLPKDFRLEVISEKDDFDLLQKQGIKMKPSVIGTDMNKYFLLYCSMGEVASPEYRIKVEDIAQRGNVVEVKVSINSPVKIDKDTESSVNTYLPEDIVRIDRSSLPSRGKLYFIFKTQSGNQLTEINRIIE